MQIQDQYSVQARALQADILGAPTVHLPRREILLEWLSGFIGRAKKASYELGETEASDLAALGQYLREALVPVAP